MSAGTVETQSGSGRQPASAVANGDGPQITGDFSMTDTTDQQAVTVAQEDRDAAHDLAMLHFLYTSEQMQGIKSGVLDHVSFVQAFARHRLASVSSASAEEAAHLQTIDERDAAEAALSDAYRAVCGKEPAWSNLFGYQDAIEEIREASASPEPVPATNQAGEVREAWERNNPFPKVPYGCEHWAEYLLPQANWYKAKAEFIRSLATQPATSQEGEVAAAKAIRSAFFTSVSGEKPHRYHLSLAYPTMEAMHEAEDAIKAWAKSVLDNDTATQSATLQEGEKATAGLKDAVAVHRAALAQVKAS